MIMESVEKKNPTLSPALTQVLNERMSPSKDSKPRIKEEVNKARGIELNEKYRC